MLSNEMLYPVLGVEGVSCKEIGVYGAIRWALKLGVNRFDIGKMCGSKDEILKAFEGARIEDDVKREDLVLSVCCGKKDGENLREELEQKLKDFELENMDICFLSGKEGELKNDVMLIDKWRELENMYKEGKCLAIGVENVGIIEMEKLLDEVDILPMVCRIKRNPFMKNEKLADWLIKNNIAVEVLALEKEEEEKLLNNEVLSEIAKNNDVGVKELCLAWNLRKEMVVNSIFSDENKFMKSLKALNLELDKNDMKRIDELEQNMTY